MGAAVLLAIAPALAACASGHRATGGSQTTSTIARPGAYVVSQRVYSENHLPRPLVSRIAAEARRLTRGLGDSSVKTAEVYGPRSRIALVRASSRAWERTTARERTGFYLIVVRGHFVCHSCSVPAGGKAPRGTIAADIWSRTEGGTDFGLSRRLPAAMSRLGSPTVISLG